MRVRTQQASDGSADGNLDGVGRRTDAQRTELEAREQLDLAPEFGLALEKRRAALQQQLAEGGRPDAVLRAIEQADAELLFERGDAARKRRLRQVQRLRRPRVVAVPAEGQRVPQVAQLEHDASILSDRCARRIGRASRGTGKY